MLDVFGCVKVDVGFCGLKVIQKIHICIKDSWCHCGKVGCMLAFLLHILPDTSGYFWILLVWLKAKALKEVWNVRFNMEGWQE